MRTTPLHPRFGVEIHDIDINEVTTENRHSEIRAAFETHSLLLFRNQDLDNAAHIRFAGVFGSIEDRHDNRFNSPTMTNQRADGTLAGEDDIEVIGLKANMLWHIDSTFMPVPALAAVITSRAVPSSGGETEYASTRAAFADMPLELKQRARNAVLQHRYSHSRAQISAELAREEMFTKWKDQFWRAVWTNPVTGEEALFVASHAMGVVGMDECEGSALIRELIDFASRDEYVYPHRWHPGDVLMWDERALMHRGKPWLYDEERTLDSYVISALESDGIDSVRAVARR